MEQGSCRCIEITGCVVRYNRKSFTQFLERNVVKLFDKVRWEGGIISLSYLINYT
jgi:hypothetical protein